MTARHSNTGAASTAAIALLALATAASASDYPPPPGSYRSGPVETPAVPRAGRDTQAQADHPANAAGGPSPKMLPLPVADTDSAIFGATNLFGAAPADGPSAGMAPHDAVTPAAQDTVEPSGNAVMPAQGRPAPAFRGGYAQQAAPGYAGYPPQVPGYPAYQPYPGAAPGAYPPGVTSPGYPAFPDGYGAAYPRTGLPPGGYPTGTPLPPDNPGRRAGVSVYVDQGVARSAEPHNPDPPDAPTDATGDGYRPYRTPQADADTRAPAAAAVGSDKEMFRPPDLAPDR